MNQLYRVCQNACLLAIMALVSALAVAIPVILTLGNDPAGLRGVAVLAAGPDRHTIATPISLLSTPNVTVERGTLAIQRRPGDAQTKTSRQEDLAALEAGRKALVLENGLVRIDLASKAPRQNPANGRYVTLTQNANQRHAIAPEYGRAERDALAPIMSALAEYRYTGLALRGCAFLFENGNGKVARLDDVNLDIAKRSGDRLHVEGTFRFRGETIQVKSDIGTAPKEQSKAQGHVLRVPISARFTSRLLKAGFDGDLTLSSPVQIIADDASVEMMSVALGGQWLGLPWPTTSAKDTFGARGKLAWSPRAITFENAAFSLGENRAAGALSLTYGDDRPRIEGTLAARHLNLEKIFVRPSTSSALAIVNAESWLAQLGVPSWPGFSSFVSAIDADVRISARKLTGTGFDAASAAVALSLNDGKMLADIAEVEFYNGGTANLQFSFDASSASSKASLRARMNGIEISDAMRHVFDHELLGGRGDMTVDLNGNGSNRTLFKNSATGKVSLSIPGVATLNIPASEDAAAHPLFGGRTVLLEQLETNVIVTNGVATFAPLTAKSQFGPVTAKGWVSVPRKYLDLEVMVSSDEPTSADSPSANRYVLHKMNVVGPWRSPKVISSDVVDRSNARDGVPLKSAPSQRPRKPL